MMKKPETAVLVGISVQTDTENAVNEHLDELEFLAQTAGAQAVKRFKQNLTAPNPKLFVGPGKLEEIKKDVTENAVDMVIFDDELSPGQLRNIERELEGTKVMDRNNLILDIFATNAKTAQAKTQVELAQNQYLLPRLTKMWTHLSRQKGGIGMRGPGETEIETDRRIVRQQITLLKEKLKKIDVQNVTRRKARTEKIRVSLVGYTNAGKSTLMNMLSDATVLAENKLFATLDTTVRKVVVGTTPFLLSDTVGFIRKLPHTLVESFKSTLDEVKEADILMHVVDISHPQHDEQIAVVQKTLEELGVAHKPVLLVYNKIDAFDVQNEEGKQMDLEEKLRYLKESFMKHEENVVFVSAAKNINLQELRDTLLRMVKAEYKFLYPHNTLPDEDYENQEL
ncbi:MAG: GTPase HflX [Sphingobacteriales bacterium]|nr:MAG: GTPase HflX [Sphingobacteriales bacterium]